MWLTPALQDPELAPFMARFAASKAVISRTSYEVQYAKVRSCRAPRDSHRRQLTSSACAPSPQSFLAICSVGLKEDTGTYLYAEARPVVRL